MMKFEIKKIFNKTDVLILLAILIMLSILSPILTVRNYETFDENGTIISGRQGVNYDKKIRKDIKILDEGVFNDALKLFHQYTEDEAYGKVETKYPGIMALLIRAYSPPFNYDIKNLKIVNNADDFYKKRISIVEKTLNMSYPYKMFEQWEKTDIINKAESLKTPLKYGYFDGWKRLFENCQMVIIGVLVLAIVSSSQVFTYEKEIGMWEILQAFPERILRKNTQKKIISIFFIIFCVYTSLIAFMFLYFSFIFKLDYGIPIQADASYFLSLYTFTFESAFLMQYFMGLLSILAITVMSLCINRFCAKSVTSLILSTIVVGTPFVLSQLLFLPLIMRKIFSICPINGVMLSMNLVSEQYYNWIGVHILKIPSICIFNIFIIVLGLFLLQMKNMRGQ